MQFDTNAPDENAEQKGRQTADVTDKMNHTASRIPETHPFIEKNNSDTTHQRSDNFQCQVSLRLNKVHDR
jgi:hypothetical protein